MISITCERSGKLHDAGWKNSYFTSADVSILGYGCVVSQYPQFYYQDKDNYQLLPRPYRESFYGYPEENIQNKNVC